MRKGLLVVVGVLFVAALASSAVAAQKTATKTMRAWGTVASVNAEAKTLTVKEKSGDVTFKLGDMVKIKEGSKTLAVTDLKADQHVSVHYTMSGQDKVASVIYVSTRHAMAKTSTKKP
jgi:uncharacterized protein YodC (DUF2158 family)